MPYYRDLLNGGKQPMFAGPPVMPKDPRELIHSQILQETAMKGLGPAQDALMDLPTLESPLVRP
jgi:hypothetical protein